MRKVKSVITVVLCATLCIIGMSACSPKKITGNEWLLKQQVCLEDLQAFSSGMDEVYTLYIMGSISNNDFIAEVKLLQQQYTMLNAVYEKLKEDNPVKEESHSYLSKRGSDGMQAVYTTLGEVLTNTFTGDGTLKGADELCYIYLAYKQTLATHLAEYTTAVTWYRESIGDTSSAEDGAQRAQNGAETSEDTPEVSE